MVKIIGVSITLITVLLVGCASTAPGYVATYPAATPYPAVTTYTPAVRTTGYRYNDSYSTSYTPVGYYPATTVVSDPDSFFTPGYVNSYYLGY